MLLLIVNLTYPSAYLSPMSHNFLRVNTSKILCVPAGTQRILDVFTLRKLCDIGDKYADGYVRFTIRSNIEYMVKDASKVDPLIEELNKEGFIVGGTKNSVAMISHTQGPAYEKS